MSDMITLLASTSWAPFFQTAIGALIGAGCAVAGGAFGSWFTWQKERQSVAAALAGEVQGFIDVVKWREIRELIPLSGYKFPINDHPFPVFDANIGKIGLLPANLASEVVEYYSHASGVVQDFQTINKGEILLNEKELRAGLLKGIDTLQGKAKVLVPELRKEAAKTWKDYLQPG
jgi:hypothetical protein